MFSSIPSAGVPPSNGGGTVLFRQTTIRHHRPRRRRRFRLPRTVPISFVSLTLILIAVGQTSFDLPQTTSPELETEDPIPSPFTETTPQSSDASPSNTRPTGTAPLSAQSSGTTATTDGLTDGPTISPQPENGTATTTQPSGAASDSFHGRNTTHFRPTDPLDQEISGTAVVQSQHGQRADFDPTGTLPTGSLQKGTLRVDADGDGSLETVYFVLTDTGSAVLLDLSAEDTQFGEGDPDDQVVKLGNDEQLSTTASSGSGEVWIGTSSNGLRFRVEFSVSNAFITSLSRFFRQVTDSDKMDLDADGNADDDFFIVLSDTNSNGLYDVVDVSIGDKEFGEGGGSDSDDNGVPDGLEDGRVDFGATDNTNDERFGTTSAESGSQVADIKLGTYTFSLRFDNNPRNDSNDFRFKNTTWFIGTFTADLNADSDLDDDADIIAFALSDTNGDALYDTLDLSTDDGLLTGTSFGENGGGALSGQSPRQTGDDDDERLTTAGTSTSVRLGDHYTFAVVFDDNPATSADTSDVIIESETRFASTFVFDLDADGALEGEDETIKFSLFDTDSDGLYDLMDAGVGPGEGGVRSGSSTDGLLSIDSIEQMASGDAIKAGDTYHVKVGFAPNPPNLTDDAEITLVSKDGSPVAFTSLSSLTIDGDGDTSADDKVFFVLSDTNSDGVVDTMDISMGDTVFGELGNSLSGLFDGFVDFAETDNLNDERLTLSDVPVNVQLGTHTFEVDFDTDVFGDSDDARITSRWYTGQFAAEVAGDGTLLDLVQVDPDSDGLYTHFELDGDDSGSFESDEVHTASPTTVLIGRTGEELEAELTYSLNPRAPDSATLDTTQEDEEEEEEKSTVEESSDILVESSDDTVSETESDVQETESELQELEEQLEELEAAGDEESLEVVKEDLAETKRELAEVQEKAEEAKRANDIAKGKVPQSAESPASNRVATDASGQRIVADEVVIGLREDTPDAERRIREIASRLGGRVIGAVPEGKTYQVQVTTPFLPLLDGRIAGLKGESDVEFAVRHTLIDPSLTRAPVTPEFDPWDRRPGGNNWNLELINALDAWEISTGAKRTKVGVIDVDFDNVHRDLRDNVGLVNGKLAKGFGGHGTHVAGTICADGTNRLGITGVAWECTLNLYEFGGSSAVTALQAMIRAVAQGVRVINVSLQWVENNQCGRAPTEDTLRKVRETNDIFQRAIRFAQSTRKDVLWVFAAGNECRDTRFASPASLSEKFPENTLVVAAVERDGRLASFSNFGAGVDVAAPGRTILSTLPRECRPTCRDRFGGKSGTSMAAPHVSGLAALMLSANPSLSASEVRSCIVGTANRSVPGQDFRVIDAAGALQCATGGGATPSRPAPSPQETPPAAPQGMTSQRGGKVPCGLDPANPC